MKKRLLIAFAAMATALSGFAHEEESYVYTHGGRYQIVAAANICTNGTFKNGEALDLTGWTAISATEDRACDAIFALNDDNTTISAIDDAFTEGMYYKFTVDDPNGIYVVSMKMKSAVDGNLNYSTNIKALNAAGRNFVTLFGNTDGTFEGETEKVTYANALMLSDTEDTYNFAIEGDGKTRTFFLQFKGMNKSVTIGDVQIQKAIKVADKRIATQKANYGKAFLNVKEWTGSEDLEELMEVLEESIKKLETLPDNTTTAKLNSLIKDFDDALADFIKEVGFEDFLKDASGYTKMTTAAPTTSGYNNAEYLGDWLCAPSKRGFIDKATTDYSVGHYQGSFDWTGNVGDVKGSIYMTKELAPGVYVFAIDSRFYVRPTTSSSDWGSDSGTHVANGELIIAKVIPPAAEGDPETYETVATSGKFLLCPDDMTTGIVAAEITEAGKYRIGLEGSYAVEVKAKKGGAMYFTNPKIWNRLAGDYNQAQLNYETAVRAQITTGRDKITDAKEKIADTQYAWGKAALQEALNTYESKIEEYEAMTQADIIATYKKSYVAGVQKKNEDNETVDNEDALLEFEVYNLATRHLIAAVRDFDNHNALLTTLDNTIKDAENVCNSRMNDTATGKPEFANFIKSAKETQTTLLADDYSADNEKTINDLVADLKAKAAALPATVPAENLTTIVDINFENTAAQNESEKWEIAGTVGKMEFDAFSQTTNTNNDFTQGYDDNGELKEPGKLRVGKGDARVAFELGDMGTNILIVSCDLYAGRLTNKGNDGYHVGVFLVNEDSENVSGFYYSPYWSGANFSASYNPCNINFDKSIVPSVGQSGIDNLKIAEETNKTSYQLVLDYGTKQMYATTTAGTNFQSTTPVAFEGVPSLFILRSDFTDNGSRRCWFDNLKIQTLKADDPTGINDNTTVGKVANKIRYNVAGQQVGKNYKGIVIYNGQKFNQK